MRAPIALVLGIALLVGAVPATQAEDGPLGGTVDGVECIQPPPAAAVAGITDDGRTVPVDVLVQLDRTDDLQRAARIMARVADAYAPLQIVIRPRFERVDYATTQSQLLLEDASHRLAGRHDLAGIEAVIVLTGIDLAGVAGEARCIGAVRDAAVGGAVAVAEIGYVGASLAAFAGEVRVGTAGMRTSLLVAHELGHLLGGQHLHGTCANPPQDRGDGIAVCSIMTQFDLSSGAIWNPVEASVIRGHAVASVR